MANNPWLYSGNLQPIFNLIKGAKQAEVSKAFKAFFYRKYLGELTQLLQTFISKKYVGSDVAQDYLKQIQAQQALKMPDLATLNKLDSEIHNYVLTPSWFTGATTLCAHWAGDHCALVHSATPAFLPCHFRYECLEPNANTFTLSSTATLPSWFSQVQNSSCLFDIR